MPLPLPNQQRQSTEGNKLSTNRKIEGEQYFNGKLQSRMPMDASSADWVGAVTEILQS